MTSDPVDNVSRRERIGVGAVVLLALFAWSSTTGASIALAVLVIAFVLDREAWRALRENALFWPLAALVLYLLLRAAWAGWELPETMRPQLRQTRAWLQLPLFVCVAWWLGASVRRMNAVLLMALAGLLVGMLFDIDWSRIREVLSSEDRHLINTHPNPFALYVSTAILGILLFMPHLLGGSGWRYGVRALAVLALLAVLVEWLLLTRTRSAWLGVAVVYPAVFVAYLIISIRADRLHLRRYLVIAGAAAIAVVATVALNWSVVTQRLQAERQNIEAIATGQDTGRPMSSVLYRVNAWRFGVDKWLERPLFGWGPGSMRHLIDHSGRPELKHPAEGDRLKWIDHLHNTYLEFLLRFGLVGAGLALAVIVILLQQTWRAYRAGRLPLEHTLFIFGAFGLMAIWDMFDFRLDHFDMRHYWLLLAGMAAAHGLRTESPVPVAPSATGG